VGLKEPHGELPQVTVQVTPPFLLSLATVAVRLAVALTASEDGGEFKATEIVTGVVGGGVDEDPPQEVRQRVSAAKAKKGIVRSVFIGRLRSAHSGSAPAG
jgi:hypothetical protein